PRRAVAPHANGLAAGVPRTGGGGGAPPRGGRGGASPGRPRPGRHRGRGRLRRLGGDEEARLRAGLAQAGIEARHDLVDVTPPDVLGLLAAAGLDVVSMGRPAAADPATFLPAGAGGG